MAEDDEIELLQVIQNDELQENMFRERAEYHRKSYRYLNCFNMTEKRFKKNFRLTKELARNLINILRPHMRDRTRASGVPIDVKVFMALNFFATGSYQNPVGNNYHIQTSQPSVSRAIHEVINAINRPEILNNFIKFPNNIQELNHVRQQFFDKFGMPGIIGCVDGTHIAIVPPRNDGAPENVFVNRKGYHSINTQLICDANLKIQHVNARFPGSCNDRYIWQNCNVEPLLRQMYDRRIEGYFLLGGSGYMLRPWLLIPLENPITEAETRYNEEFVRIRSLIERCIGVLKMRFRCLLKHRVLHYSPTTVSKIINSCVVLHNMCIDANVQLDDENDEINLDLGLFEDPPIHQNQVARNPYLQAGRRMQRRIINIYEVQQIR